MPYCGSWVWSLSPGFLSPCFFIVLYDVEGHQWPPVCIVCRGDLLERRRKTIGQLFGQLSIYGAGPEPFKLLASLRKGIRLVARTLPVLDRVRLLIRLWTLCLTFPFLTNGIWQFWLNSTIRVYIYVSGTAVCVARRHPPPPGVVHGQRRHQTCEYQCSVVTTSCILLGSVVWSQHPVH